MKLSLCLFTILRGIIFVITNVFIIEFHKKTFEDKKISLGLDILT